MNSNQTTNTHQPPDQTKILQILADHLGVEKENLQPQAELAADLNLQPLELADLVGTLNQILGTDIEPQESTNWETVADILHCVSENQPPESFQK